MEREMAVTYWNGEEIEVVSLNVNHVVLAEQLTTAKPYFTGKADGSLVAIRTSQIISLVEA